MAVLLASTWAVVVAGPLVPGAAAAAPGEVAQEVALSGLGLASQTVQGRHGVVEAFFPPPVAPVAAAGSFVRVFFGHAQQVSPGSTMLIAVDGQPLSTVALGAGTAAGGVVEAKIPSPLLDRGAPTRLQVTFDLDLPRSGSSAQLYGRVDATTLVHYRLAVAAESAPGLETYPHSLLGTDAASPATPVLKVALPSPPDMEEAAAAFRALVDLGRRAATQRVRVGVIGLGQLPAPDTRGAGVLIVGRLDHLAAATSVLTAAGWRSEGTTWVAPDGVAVGPGDGLLVSALSPWDGRTPMVLATGASDEALARAVSALVQPGPIPIGGAYAVLPAAGGEAPAAPATRTLQISAPAALAPEGPAPGEYRVGLAFVAPAIARDGSVRLGLTLPPLRVTGEAEVAVGGARVASVPLSGSGSRPTVLQTTFAGRLLRPGLNALTLALRIDQLAEGAAGGGPIAATLQLPAAPRGGPDLAALPFPFVGDGDQAGVRVVLADTGAGTLTAAAETAVALGHRAAAPPGRVEAALAGDAAAISGAANLIVIGAPLQAGPLAPIAGGLPLRVSGSGEVVLDRAGQPSLRLPASLAAVQEARAGARMVLWLGGGRTPGRAAAALYESGLEGTLALMGPAGLVSVVPPSGHGQPAASTTAPAAAWTAGLLVLLVAAALLGVAVWLLVGTRGLVA